MALIVIFHYHVSIIRYLDSYAKIDMVDVFVTPKNRKKICTCTRMIILLFIHQNYIPCLLDEVVYNLFIFEKVKGK